MTASSVLWLHSHFMLPAGGTKFVYEVVSRLAQRRPVEVMVDQASLLWRERYAEAGVTLHETGTTTSTLYWAGLPAAVAYDTRKVRAAAARADTLVSSFFPMPHVAGKVAAEQGKRHVSLCFEPFPLFHDAEFVGMYPRAKQVLLAFLRTAYGRYDMQGIRSADALLTLNESTKAQMAAVYGRDDAVCTYAGVDTELFRPYTAEETAHLRERTVPTDDEGAGPLVVHSTDFSPIKRTDLAIEAFAVAAAEVPDARLAITSTREDPPVWNDLQRRAERLGVRDRIVYLGFLPYEDLPRLYSLADVLLQTGTSVVAGATTMSLPVKEALACQTPVVRSGATGEDVVDGVSGFLVDPNDSATTGARLAEILGDPRRARAMGAAGRERIMATYVWDAVVDVVEQALDSRTGR